MFEAVPERTIRIVEASAEWGLAVRGRLLVGVWRTGVQLAQIERVDRTVAELVRGSQGLGYCSVTVIEQTMSMLVPEDARAASTALQKRWGNDMKASAYLVEGAGFMAAGVRTMTAGMSLMTRSPYPIRVFADVGPLATWIGATLHVPPLEVEETIETVRSARW